MNTRSERHDSRIIPPLTVPRYAVGYTQRIPAEPYAVPSPDTRECRGARMDGDGSHCYHTTADHTQDQPLIATVRRYCCRCEMTK